MKTYFSQLGVLYKVKFARNGQEVIDLVKNTFISKIPKQSKPGEIFKPIDLLILDFQMPYKNGFQVQKEVGDFYNSQKFSLYSL